MPGNNPGCSRPLHPIQTSECGPCLTLGPVPTGQWRLFFPHKCTHWVVHLKKHFLREFIINCSSQKYHHTTLCTKVKKTFTSQSNKLQTLISFLAFKPYRTSLFKKFLQITMLKHIIFVNTKVFLKSKLINTQKNVLNQPE